MAYMAAIMQPIINNSIRNMLCNRLFIGSPDVYKRQVTVSDLNLPENVRAVFDQNYALVSIISKSKDEAAEGEDA